MDQAFIKDVIGWDVVNWSKAISFWERHLPKGKSLECLELGGNKGGLSLWLASKGHHVVCSDLTSPTEEALALHNKYSIQDLVSYENIDATDVKYRDHFDVVIFKSILGGIARNGNDKLKSKVVSEAYKALKPGGVLLFAENLEASLLHRFMRRTFTRWGASWNYLKYSEAKDLFSEFKSLDTATAGYLGAFGKTEAQRRFLGNLDTSLLEKLVAKGGRYILYGAAQKG